MPNCRHRRDGLAGKTRGRIASYALLQQRGLRRTWADRHFSRQSLTQYILQKNWERHSWDFVIFVHFGGSPRLGNENGFEGSKNVGSVEDCAIDGGVNEIDLSAECQKKLKWM